VIFKTDGPRVQVALRR